MEPVKTRNLKLFGHIARMVNERLLKLTAFGKVERVRSRGSPPKRWIDDITNWCQADLRQVMQLAQDQDEWNMFMCRLESCIAKKEDDFLI